MLLRRAASAYRSHGPRETAIRGLGFLKRQLNIRMRSLKWRLLGANEYHPPSSAQLQEIEGGLIRAGFDVDDYFIDQTAFSRFIDDRDFPSSYYAYSSSEVRTEKLLEHFIAWDLLDLESFGFEDLYLDIAAYASPWVKILREQGEVDAVAIDLGIGDAFADLPFYQEQDATRTSFTDQSVRGVSLQCAFEMFEGDSDVELIRELGRILRPGGKAVILPLYMHVEYCSYATPEHFGRGHALDGAKEYIRYGFSGVPSSRKYDVEHFNRRVADQAHLAGLDTRLLVARNTQDVGPDIYCHFVLEILKPRAGKEEPR